MFNWLKLRVAQTKKRTKKRTKNKQTNKQTNKQLKQAQPNWSPAVPNFRGFQPDFNPANTKFQKISPNGLGLANFLNFGSILAVFLVKKRPKKAEIQKKFFCSIFCWEASTYQISENFFKRFGFWPFFFGCFLVKKRPKKAEIQKKFFMAFSLLRSIYIPNFRKFHQTVQILPIFFIFGQFWLFLG